MYARRRALAAGLLLCSYLLTGAHAQDQVKDVRYYTQQAVKAYRAKDFAGYLENMKQAHNLRPNHPTIMYNLAGAYALNANQNEALVLLNKVAAMGLIYPAAEDEDFNSIKDSAGFKTLLKSFEANKAPINHSTTAFTLEEKGLITEGVAYDSQTETFYVSSAHKRKILSINKQGQVRDFSSAQDGLWSVLGMKVDARRRHLWVATTAIPQMLDFAASDKNRAGVFKYDLKTGKLLKKYLLPDTVNAHTFGDLAVHPSSGDVYVTDSLTAAVYVISKQKDELELFAGPEPFASPQGLDFSADGKQLFVADYGRGIFVSDVKTKKFVKLEQAETVALLGIDGLYFYKGSLIAIQNGLRPHRVVRAHLNPAMNRVERLEIIEANHPSFDEPTLGVIAGDSFYFIANSQWGSINEQGQLAAADKLHRPIIMKAKLF